MDDVQRYELYLNWLFMYFVCKCRNRIINYKNKIIRIGIKSMNSFRFANFSFELLDDSSEEENLK